MNSIRRHFDRFTRLKRFSSVSEEIEREEEHNANYQPLVEFDTTSSQAEEPERATRETSTTLGSDMQQRSGQQQSSREQQPHIMSPDVNTTSTCLSSAVTATTVINGTRSRNSTAILNLSDYRDNSSTSSSGNATRSASASAPTRRSFFNNFLFSTSGSMMAANRRHQRTHRNRFRQHLSNNRSRSSRRSAHTNTLNHLNLLSNYHSRNLAASTSNEVVTLPASCSNYAFTLTSSTPSSMSSASSQSSSLPTCFSLLGDNGNRKKSERNLLSACCGVFCLAILAVSLVETRWFYLNGGGCNLSYLGVAHFFSPGQLNYHREMSKVDKIEIDVYDFVSSSGLVLTNCANQEILLIMRLIIAFIFLAIFSSSIALMLDLFGCMKSGVKVVRRHGIFHILTVLLCLTINGFCFWISERIYQQQEVTRFKKGKKIEVSFDVSYYMIVMASSLSILATAFTLIKRYPTDEDDQLERLIEEYTGFEEPIHLERSLPAVSHAQLANQQQQSMLRSSSCAQHEQDESLLLRSNDTSNVDERLCPNTNDLNNNNNDTYDYANSNDLLQYNSQQQQQPQSQQQYQHQPARLSTLSRLSLQPVASATDLTSHQRHCQQQVPPPPPLTPPPSLHSASIYTTNAANNSSNLATCTVRLTNTLNQYRSNESLLDPPPPYDPTPVLA